MYSKLLLEFLSGKISSNDLSALQIDPTEKLLLTCQELVALNKEISAENIFFHSKDSKILYQYMDIVNQLDK